ncbi:50S ribosomal protein L18, partial [Aetokthonos hydrillicola]
MKLTRRESKHRRHRRVRGKVNGSPERPRLCVFRSHEHIYAQ